LALLPSGGLKKILAMPQAPPRFPRTLAVLIVLALPALVLLWLAFPGVRPQDALARRWQAELAVLPPEELAVRMRQLADLGDAGLPVLAESLCGEREETADAAYSALEIELVRWRALSPTEASRRAAILARELARHAESAGGEQRRAAAEIASRLLTWPLDPRVADRAELLADCEKVFRAAVQSAPRESHTELARNSKPADLPDGAGAARIAPPDDVSAAASPAEVQVATMPMRIGDDEPEVEAASPAAVTSAPRSNKLTAPAPFTSSSAKPLAPLRTISEQDDLSLMRRLHTADEAAAERELMRRGYTAIRLKVARQLTNPDPQVRRELAELLPQMSGLDARPWLLWLSEDADPGVRRAAAAILATSTDPKLLARLRALKAAEREE
jgi:hypothetical protein